jgi:hypothetical protein
MKEISLLTPINKFLGSLFHTEKLPPNTAQKGQAGKQKPVTRAERPERKDFVFYSQVIDQETLQVIGHLSDISYGGFKLDCQNILPVNKDFRLRMNLNSEVAGKPFMEFTARSRWCKVDPIDPCVYNIGCQLVDISREDLEIFNRMMELYGRDYADRRINFRRSNQW